MNTRLIIVGMGLACVLALGGCTGSSSTASTSSPASAQTIKPAPQAEPAPEAASTQSGTPKIAPPIGADGLVAVSNAYCPLEPEHPVKPRVRPENARMWKGQAVGFCCEDCPEAWDAMTPEQRNAALTKAGDR